MTFNESNIETSLTRAKTKILTELKGLTLSTQSLVLVLNASVQVKSGLVQENSWYCMYNWHQIGIELAITTWIIGSSCICI